MALRNRITRSVFAGLACLGLLTGCAGGHQRKVRVPWPPQWPEHWARPSFKHQSEGPPLPVPADPSGSPYGPQSPRGLYVPSGPAPESKLGLPVPPPLPPGGDEPAPAPGRLPPAPDDMDVSFQNDPQHRPEIVPPPPPNGASRDVPRIAERVDTYDRYRQPVRLAAPEIDPTAENTPEFPSSSSIFRRSPVKAFPQMSELNQDLDRKSGHTPPFDDDEADDSESVELPDGVDSTRMNPAREEKESLPVLRDPDEAELTFPGVHKQTSADKTGKPARVERLATKLSIEKFHLTRDARPDAETEVIQSNSLKSGQNLVVRTQLNGLKKVQRGGQLVTRVTFHFEVRDAKNHMLFATPKATSTEPMHAEDATRTLAKWLAIPSALKPGKYILQMHLQDGFSRQTGVVEMPIEVH